MTDIIDNRARNSIIYADIITIGYRIPTMRMFSHGGQTSHRSLGQNSLKGITLISLKKLEASFNNIRSYLKCTV